MEVIGTLLAGSVVNVAPPSTLKDHAAELGPLLLPLHTSAPQAMSVRPSVLAQTSSHASGAAMVAHNPPPTPGKPNENGLQ